MIKTRKHWSKIWDLDKETLSKIVKESKTFTAIAKHLGMMPKGGNFSTIKRKLNLDKIDYSHIPTGRHSNVGISRGGTKKIPLEKILVKNSTYNRCHLKKRLIKEKIIKYICSECNLNPEKLWNNKILILVLDHKNGISNDNRKNNLRFLCPNCNSQTDTFAGKNKHYSAVD